MQTTAIKHGVLLVLVGPSGVGKSTIARRLAEKLAFHFIASVTTRSYKPGDQNQKTYEYLTREQFSQQLENDEFLEYANVFDNDYATPKHPALEYIAQGEDVLLEVDVQGALQVRAQYPDALLIFILPPTEQTLLERLTSRGRETPAEVQKRYRNARREIAMARGSRAFDRNVINDNLDRCVDEIVHSVEQKKHEQKEPL